MAEMLLSRKQVSHQLNISPRTFSRYKARFIAMGLKAVRLGRYEKFLKSSLDKLIDRIVKSGGLR